MAIATLITTYLSVDPTKASDGKVNVALAVRFVFGPSAKILSSRSKVPFLLKSIQTATPALAPELSVLSTIIWLPVEP
ncbi:hypothetical protein D3C87_2002380 [compost metagenome]